MLRRPRIKVVANLSVGRRSINKTSDELNKNNKNDETNSEDYDGVVNDAPSVANVSSECEPATVVDKVVSAISKIDNVSNLNENVSESCPAVLDNKVTNSEVSSTSQTHDNTFKTPMNLPKNDSDISSQSSIPSKYRKFKFAPRLDSHRNAIKPQEKDEYFHRGEENHIEREENATIASQSSLTPISPASSNENLRRPQTPQEHLSHHSLHNQHSKETSNIVINQNVPYPQLSHSPFPYHGHGRIRTESVTSLKSSRDYTVANLHPRKVFREDQKMLDIKRESRERLSKKDIDKSKLRMFDMIYFNPQNNPMKPRAGIKIEKIKIDLKREPSPSPPPPEKSTTKLAVPRLKLNASGEMVLDESSLVVENEQQRQNRILIANNTVVYDDDLSGSYGIYKRQQRTREWLHDETVKFYRCLNTVGTDFSMMLNLFPNRTRRDLKLKFKKEEKNNPHLVDKALLKHNVFDLDELQRDLDQEEAEKRKKREESSKSEVKEHLKRKILKNQEAKLKAEERSRSKIEKILSDGDLAFKIAEENQLKENLDVKKKRKYTKKSKEETSSNSDGLQMLAGFPGLSSESQNDRRRTRKKKADADAEEPTAKISKMIDRNQNRKPAKESSELNSTDPKVTLEKSSSGLDFSQIPIEIQSEKEDSLQQRSQMCESIESENLIQDVDSIICFDQTEANETFEKSPNKNHTLLMTTNECSFENAVDEPMESQYTICVLNEPPKASDDVPLAAEAINHIVPEHLKSTSQTVETVESISSNSVSSPMKSKNKSKKKKFKPTLITRMKLDANGEMVPEDVQENIPAPAAAKEAPASKIDEQEQPVKSSTATRIEDNLNQIEKPQPARQQEIQEEQPTTSSKVQEAKSYPCDEFDDEAFLRSLDLDNLAIVEAQKEDKLCYEIYKSDPITQEILGEPLNLPQKYIDLIVKLMTQPDDVDEVESVS